MRSSSIPNNTSFDSNIYAHTNNSLKKKLLASARRLSVKAEQIPNDSIC